MRRQWALMTEVDLARTIAERLGLYDKEQEAEALGVLTEKLAALTKQELMCVFRSTEFLVYERTLTARIKALQAGSTRSVLSRWG